MNKERIFVNVLKYTIGLPFLVLISVLFLFYGFIIIFFSTLFSFLGKVSNTAPDEYDLHKERISDFKLFLSMLDIWKPWKKQPPEKSFLRLESVWNVLSDIRDNTKDKED